MVLVLSYKNDLLGKMICDVSQNQFIRFVERHRCFPVKQELQTFYTSLTLGGVWTEQQSKVRQTGIYNGTLYGKLISKTVGKDSLSEGPEYFLIPTGQYSTWKEILVRKKVHMWQNDPELHPHLNENVSIMGEIIQTKDRITMDYSGISREPFQLFPCNSEPE